MHTHIHVHADIHDAYTYTRCIYIYTWWYMYMMHDMMHIHVHVHYTWCIYMHMMHNTYTCTWCIYMYIHMTEKENRATEKQSIYVCMWLLVIHTVEVVAVKVRETETMNRAVYKGRKFVIISKQGSLEREREIERER